MKTLSRRHFFQVSAGIAAGTSVSLELPAAVLGTLRGIRFGACADPHKDIMHDADHRLRTFIGAANHERVDFVIQLGDFCRPYEKNRGFLSIWEGFDGARYHTLGNHDNDGGFKWEQVQQFWQMPSRYYSFDRGGWHFVVLDGNEIKPENRAPGYPRYIGATQRAWVRNDLAKTHAPTIVFSHQSLEDPLGVENAPEVRALLEQANAEAGWRKVGVCFSGHHHIDYATEMAGIHYVQVNSMSYHWLGDKYQHVRYSAEIDRDYPYIKYTVPYRDPLFAMVTLAPEGRLIIAGVQSEFVGPDPWELGLKEVKGTASDRKRLTPWVSNREIQVQVQA